MNAEIAKIRKIRNKSEVFDYNPKRISDSRMNEIVYELNTNFSDLYAMQKKDDIDINDFVNKIITNVYLVLNMFNEMGVYPDYFYDAIVKMNIEYRKIVDANNSLRGNYGLFNEVKLSSHVAKVIKVGLENGYYHIQAYPMKDINDAFLEMVGFFQAYNIPYNINTKEQCKKVFQDINFNHINIISQLLTSDYIFVDIECMARLLFEYLSFFVSMGIQPKEYLDQCINDVEGIKRK